MTRFLGRGLRHKIPNSVDRTVDGKELIRIRREAREKRVKKRARKLMFGISVGKYKVSDLMKLVL